MRDCGLESSQVAAQHVGLDLDQWVKTTRKGINGHKPKLLFVGGDFCRKGGRTLLDLFNDELNEHFLLDIVTKTDIGRPPMNCRVFYDLRPGDSQLIELFQQADIFVFPTEADLVPWVVLEAMASQCAIVASRIGGIPDMVTPACGILIDPAQGNELREALLTLAGDPERREAMGLAARMRIEAAYDASKNVPKIFELIKGWIDNRRRIREKGD